jgi:predicted nucleic acid-binding protein
VKSEPPYLLDTTVLIDVARRREPATSWLSNTIRRPIQTCVSAVTVAEFFAGVRPEQRRDWQYFIDGLIHWEVTKEIAIRAGSLRYDLAREGRTMQIADALIAATAVVHGAALVTANITDFAAAGLTTVRLEGEH